METNKNIEYKISKLSPDLINELDHFLDYLIDKKATKKQKKLKQDWAGSLKDVDASGIELQKKSLIWREKKNIS